MHDTAFNMTLN